MGSNLALFGTVVAHLIKWEVNEVNITVSLGTLQTVANLEAEMTRAGRVAEEGALREVLQALGRPEFGFLSEEEASTFLGIPADMVRQWASRGALAGVELGGRWLVARESVERTRRLRDALGAMDEEGNPTADEIETLYRPERRLGPTFPGTRGTQSTTGARRP